MRRLPRGWRPAGLLAGGLIVLASVGAVVGGWGDVAAPAVAAGWGGPMLTARDEPWPPFVMVVDDTEDGYGWNGAPATQRFRVEYTDRRHFTVTLISNPTLPGVVGSGGSFNGDKSVSYDALHRETRTTFYGPAEYTVPFEWLVPGSTTFFQRPNSGWRSMSLGNGQRTVTRDMEIPVNIGPPGAPPTSVKKVMSRREITFRETDSIPTQVIDMSDGRVVKTVKVVELRTG